MRIPYRMAGIVDYSLGLILVEDPRYNSRPQVR